jgi:hypothetical protein
MVSVSDMDDLALQFDGTDAGKRFIDAWKRARIIVDTGGGHGGTSPTPPTSAHSGTRVSTFVTVGLLRGPNIWDERQLAPTKKTQTRRLKERRVFHLP